MAKEKFSQMEFRGGNRSRSLMYGGLGSFGNPGFGNLEIA
jgi:hypothetical protein